MRVSTMLSVLSLSFLLGGCFGPKYGDPEEAKTEAATKGATSTAAHEDDGTAVDGTAAADGTANTPGGSDATRATDALPVCSHDTCLDFEGGASFAPFMADTNGACAVTGSNTSSGKGALKCEGGGLVLERAVNGATFAFDAFVDGPTATANTEDEFAFGRVRLRASSGTWVDLEYRVTFEEGRLGVIEFLVDMNDAGQTKTLSFPTNLPLGKWHHFEIHYDRTENGVDVQATADGVVVLEDGHITSGKTLAEEELSIFGGGAPYAVVFDEVEVE